MVAVRIPKGEFDVKTNSTLSYIDTRDTIFNKSTKVLSYTESRPAVTSVGFTVLADNTHGDHKTVNLHEFRKNYLQDYIGTLHQENSTQILDRVGKIGIFSQFVNAAGLIDANNLYNSALSHLFDQLRTDGVGSGLDLSVDIAEGRQVRGLLQNAANVSNYIRGLGLNRWSKRWLEYQYGWKPLVNSVYGSFDALMHRRLYSYMHVTGKARRFVWSENKFSDTWGPGSRESVFTAGRYRYKIVANYELKNTVKQQLSGYTSLNPVSIAWELMPYSFVVDWFYDIGGYLRNLESALLFNSGFVNAYTVYGYKVDQQGVLGGSGTSLGITNVWNADALSRQSYKQRTPIVFPIPRIPRFHADLGWQRCVSGASLLANFLHIPGRGPGLPGKMPDWPGFIDP